VCVCRNAFERNNNKIFNCIISSFVFCVEFNCRCRCAQRAARVHSPPTPVADRSAAQTSHYHYRTTRHKNQQNDYCDYGRDKECPAGRQRTGKGRRRHHCRDQQQTDGEQRQETGGGGEGRQGSDARRSCRTTAAKVHREEAELR